jgi:tetratricopeptide (TPR) repeat protein
MRVAVSAALTLLAGLHALLAPVPPAYAFRAVAVGDRVPVLAVSDARGATVTVPAPGLTVVLFWRAGQALSEDALRDLAALATRLAATRVGVVAIADKDSPPERVRSAAGAQIRTLHDVDGRAAQAWGVIVTPSTALVDGTGRLVWYLPSRTGEYAKLVDAHVAHARREISDAELARRVQGTGETVGAAAQRGVAAYKRGVVLADERRWDEAARALTDSLAADPTHLDAVLRLGWVELERGRAREALARFSDVLDREPAHPGARLGRAIATLRAGQVEDGIELLEEAVTLNPEPVRGHWELGRAYEAKGDAASALEHYRWAYLKLLQGRR